ncbi:hypothetical protein [Pseudomonas sp. K5]|uniref:hypothetical protein n=1 Tax=Pseudomonas sp. K5 TaxID=1156313 RepID=UPI001867D13D|nr:hypothetical protein [Pseudomonas sp. K5]
MCIEIEQGASMEGIACSLKALNVQLDAEGASVSGFFQSSHCQFGFEYDSSPQHLLAESVQVDWRVGLRGSFHYRADNLHGSWADIVAFIQRYAASQPFEFVVSFQLETAYVVRDVAGLRIVRPSSEAG